MENNANINYIPSQKITDAVSALCISANKQLPEDIGSRISKAAGNETLPLAREIMADLERNLTLAREMDIPICQDTGMAVVFVQLGNRVIITGDTLEEAINKGVARGYRDGLLRCSVVGDPLERQNTRDNTPAVIHLSMTKGSLIRLTVAPKGFGSENMSGIKMLTPAAGKEDIINTVVEIVKAAGSNPCPPMVVGVGIGGDFEYCALLAKKALCRPVDRPNPKELYAGMERELLERINKLGIGPQGFGGKTTALAVNIETWPTHIAGLPVAVNIGCHVTRHQSATIA